jgi:hypothetical protein
MELGGLEKSKSHWNWYIEQGKRSLGALYLGPVYQL